MATIVSLHAHPDDEALLCGGWLTQRAAAGDRVVVVFATDGGAGLAGPTYPPEELGQVRRREGTASAQALGAARVAWLGYADSGMAGAPTHGSARLADADVSSVAAAVAAILDAEDADVLTGYDANGGYGHPDHLQVHHIARGAQGLATRRPVLMEATVDRTRLLPVLRTLRPLARLLPGLTVPGDDVYANGAAVSLVVDVRNEVDAKRAALAAHASQTRGGIRTIRILLALPRPLALRVLGTEWFNEVT